MASLDVLQIPEINKWLDYKDRRDPSCLGSLSLK